MEEIPCGFSSALNYKNSFSVLKFPNPKFNFFSILFSKPPEWDGTVFPYDILDLRKLWRWLTIGWGTGQERRSVPSVWPSSRRRAAASSSSAPWLQPGDGKHKPERGPERRDAPRAARRPRRAAAPRPQAGRATGTSRPAAGAVPCPPAGNPRVPGSAPSLPRDARPSRGHGAPAARHRGNLRAEPASHWLGGREGAGPRQNGRCDWLQYGGGGAGHSPGAAPMGIAASVLNRTGGVVYLTTKPKLPALHGVGVKKKFLPTHLVLSNSLRS